jgi:phage-related protein
MRRVRFDLPSRPEKPIEWRGTSYDDLCAFPADVRRVAGFQLGRLQQGEPPDDWKPMSIVGAGTIDIRIRVGTAHRVFVVTKFEEAIYVLHAFEKKSQRTPKSDIDLAKHRYRELTAERQKR